MKRQVIQPSESKMDASGELTLSPQALVDSEASSWTKIWHRFKGRTAAPWRSFKQWHELTWATELPPLTGLDLQNVAKTYKQCTGRGCEGLHPRWIGWLSLGLLDSLADLLNSLERCGFWPSQIQEALVVLISKKD